MGMARATSFSCRTFPMRFDLERTLLAHFIIKAWCLITIRKKYLFPICTHVFGHDSESKVFSELYSVEKLAKSFPLCSRQKVTGHLVFSPFIWIFIVTICNYQELPIFLLHRRWSFLQRKQRVELKPYETSDGMTNFRPNEVYVIFARIWHIYSLCNQVDKIFTESAILKIRFGSFSSSSSSFLDKKKSMRQKKEESNSLNLKCVRG